MNTQDWSPLGWTGWISLQSKGLLRVFSNTTVQKHQFFGTQLFFIVQLSHQTIALTRWIFAGKVMSLLYNMLSRLGFPDNPVGKESACNAEDPGSIPGSGRSTGEGIGYPLQYSWVSFVAQLVKNLPAMWDTWVQFLGWEDPLEKGTATDSSILARE